MNKANAHMMYITPGLLQIALTHSLRWEMSRVQFLAIQHGINSAPTEVSYQKVLAGIPIVEDDSMPRGQIKLKDRDGHTLFTIENLSQPTYTEGFGQDGENSRP